MEREYQYTPLSQPIPIIDQEWPEGTLPLVATSTLTFNHARYIRECLEGFLMQKTTFPVRIVIFDDCSTDGTSEIIQEYQERYPHLFHITRPPFNTWKHPQRREYGKPFREARGVAKYIAMCEGDDYWTDPLKLQKQVDFLEANPEYIMCFTNVEKYNVKDGTKQKALSYKKSTFTHLDMPMLAPTLTRVMRNKYLDQLPEIKVAGGDNFLLVYHSQFGKTKFLDRKSVV